jgi:hypothetical protein
VAPFVRKEGIGNIVFLCELLENIQRVRADGKNLDTVAVERLQIALQLDQLRLAESSPGGASVKQNECLVRASDSREANEIFELIR